MENIEEPFLESNYVDEESAQRDLAFRAYELFLEKQFKNSGIVNPEFIGFYNDEFLMRVEIFRRIRYPYLESESGNFSFSRLEDYEENGYYFIVVAFDDSGYLSEPTK